MGGSDLFDSPAYMNLNISMNEPKGVCQYSAMESGKKRIAEIKDRGRPDLFRNLFEYRSAIYCGRKICKWCY